MDGWKKYVGLKVFLRLKSNRVYTGHITELDDRDPIVQFLTIIDKFDNNVTIATSEILEIKEEQEDEHSD